MKIAKSILQNENQKNRSHKSVKATHNQCNVHTSAINIKTEMNMEGPSQGLILVYGRI